MLYEVFLETKYAERKIKYRQRIKVWIYIQIKNSILNDKGISNGKLFKGRTFRNATPGFLASGDIRKIARK